MFLVVTKGPGQRDLASQRGRLGQAGGPSEEQEAGPRDACAPVQNVRGHHSSLTRELGAL